MGAREAQEQGDICIHIADSLHYTAEISIVNHTPLKHTHTIILYIIIGIGVKTMKKEHLFFSSYMQPSGKGRRGGWGQVEGKQVSLIPCDNSIMV